MASSFSTAPSAAKPPTSGREEESSQDPQEAHPTRLLMVEDDERLAQLTARYLEQHGIQVTLVGNGLDAVSLATREVFDVVLLDLMLPGMDGVQVCSRLRARLDVPIIMVTARGEEADRVLGLELGADDYVAKPFSSRELLARIRAQVRRARGRVGPTTSTVRAGRVEVDPSRRSATVDGQLIHLTGVEFSLLRALAERAGRVLSRDQLLELVHRDAGAAFDRSIDGHISRLRQKLGDDPRKPRILKTVRGVGYLLVDEPSVGS